MPKDDRTSEKIWDSMKCRSDRTRLGHVKLLGVTTQSYEGVVNEGSGTTDHDALVDALFRYTLTRAINVEICDHCGDSANPARASKYICPKLTGNCVCVYHCYLCGAAGWTIKGKV